MRSTEQRHLYVLTCLWPRHPLPCPWSSGSPRFGLLELLKLTCLPCSFWHYAKAYFPTICHTCLCFAWSQLEVEPVRLRRLEIDLLALQLPSLNRLQTLSPEDTDFQRHSAQLQRGDEQEAVGEQHRVNPGASPCNLFAPPVCLLLAGVLDVPLLQQKQVR